MDSTRFFGPQKLNKWNSSATREFDAVTSDEIHTPGLEQPDQSTRFAEVVAEVVLSDSWLLRQSPFTKKPSCSNATRKHGAELTKNLFALQLLIGSGGERFCVAKTTRGLSLTFQRELYGN